MRKIVKLVSLMVMICMLAACSAKQEVSTFEKTQGDDQGTIVVTHTGDDVDNLKMTLITLFPVGEAVSKEVVQQTVDSMLKNTGEIKGAKVSAEVQDDRLVVNIDLDFHNIDWKQFNNTEFGQMVSLTASEQEGLNSYSALKDELLSEGYTEKK